jgi:hypothetical protein
MQNQFCKPASKANSSQDCTPLDGLIPTQRAANGLHTNSAQNVTYTYLKNAVFTNPSATGVVQAMGISALTARDYLTYGYSSGLPSDQWQKEILYWHNITMASIQRDIIEQVTGPSSPNMDSFIQRPVTPEEGAHCRKQVCALVRNTHTIFLLTVCRKLEAATLLALAHLA